ncbi:MAG: M20/M25/M40 family metallo-hydrolase [Chloroflexi bacterium]|nr:M20/M25/M40 family metallo-hydrolase [Chloroflexota bacterium]
MSNATIDWEAVRAEATDALSRYVRIDSSHPVGRTVETAAFLGERLAADGIGSRIYESPEPGKVNLVARLSAAQPVGKPLLLSHHMDVVQAVAADWRFDPYSGEVADGYVFGRGTIDDKGMGIMELMTMLLLKRHNVELKRDVIMLATCDEEIGSPMGARWMVETHFDDLDPAFVLDEGGTGKRGFYDAGDAFEVSVSEKRMVRIRLVARAEPGHASMPWHEAATHRLVRAAHTLLEQPPEDRDTPAVAEMISRLGGEAARREIASQRASMPLLHDTVSLTMLSGGYKINIIPERAEMSFDCRLLPDTDERAFVSNVEQLIGDPGVDVEVIDWPDTAPSAAPWDGALFEALQEACETFQPKAIVTPSICVGGTDARYFRERGIPSYGLVPGIFTAEDLKGFHGLDERMSIDNLVLGTKIVHAATLRVAGAR